MRIDCLVEADTAFAFLADCCGFRVVADEEALPFADKSFDLVISCLSLQFINDLPGALLQIRRLLKPDSLFVGGVMGATTLSELRSSWLQAEMEMSNGVSPRVKIGRAHV